MNSSTLEDSELCSKYSILSIPYIITFIDKIYLYVQKTTGKSYRCSALKQGTMK